MWEKSKEGKCRICGKISPLTYEHVPPRKAFNSNKAFVYCGRKILEQDSEGFPWEISSRLKGKQLQRGIGHIHFVKDVIIILVHGMEMLL